MSDTHTATHRPGGRVVCSCGWSTPQPVPTQSAGRVYAERHVSESAVLRGGQHSTTGRWFG